MTTAGGRKILTGEQRTVTSPAWLIPVDDFRRLRSADGVTAALDRWDGHTWQPTNVVAVRTPGDMIVYPGLNFRPWPFEPQPELFRCRLGAPGRYPLLHTEAGEFRSDLIGAVFLAYPYDHDHPPELPSEPLVVPMLPGPAYPFPPGTRVVRGTVKDAVSATRSMMPAAASTTTAKATAAVRATRLLPRREDAGTVPETAAALGPGSGDASRVRRRPVDGSLLVVMLASLPPAPAGDARPAGVPAGAVLPGRIPAACARWAQANGVAGRQTGVPGGLSSRNRWAVRPGPFLPGQRLR